MKDPTIALLRNLVAIDSVNPSLVAGGAGESRIAAFLADEMRSVGMRVQTNEVAPGRPNVVGVLEERSAGRSLLMCGHIDTVGVVGMNAPFEPVEVDGRVYGRGAQDMKGGVAAMLGAARILAQSGGLKRGKLIVAAVADEEYASLGAEALVSDWKADAAVVTEPTDLKVAVGHKGFSWVEVTTRGRAAHGSRPQDGRDAIFRMGRVLSRLEALDGEIQSSSKPHPIQGTGSLHASVIIGGRELSTYPEHCSLQFERRTTSHEPKNIAITEVEQILTELKSDDSEFEAAARLLFDRAPFETPSGHELPYLLESALRRIGQKAERGGVSFWTDAAVLASAGIPTVVFGPGGEGLHSTTEYVRISEVLSCRDALVDLARQFCEGNR